MSEPVLFYMQEFYCFDNFSAFRVWVWEQDWMTAEHAYQAAKFRHISILYDLIYNARSAHDAKQTAKRFSHHTPFDWQPDRCVSVMEEVLRVKLSQHLYIQRKLLETEDRPIIETSPTDSFWGWGPDKEGENHLGRIWMKLRTKLREGRK